MALPLSPLQLVKPGGLRRQEAASPEGVLSMLRQPEQYISARFTPLPAAYQHR